MRDILLLAVTLGCSFAALRRPFAGLLAFVFYGLFAPQTWVWFIARDLPHSAIIGGCTILGYCFSPERKRLPMQRETILMGSLWFFFAASTLFAVEPLSALPQLVLLSKIFLMVFLSISMLNSQGRIYAMIRVMALALGLYGLKGAIFFLGTGGTGRVVAPLGSFLSSNNSLGLALVFNLALLVYVIKMESNVWLKRLIKTALIASYPAIIGTFSRGAWVAAVIVSALLIWRAERKAILLVGGGVLAALVLMLLPAMLSNIISEQVVQRYQTLENIEEDATAQERLWSWEFCKRVGLGNPLLGAGFKYYSLAAYAKYYPEMLSRFPGRQWSCHSTWFTVFSEHGVVGFFLWLWLIISCLMSLRQIRLYGRALPEMRWAVQLARAIEISLVGFMVGGSFVDFAYFDGYYQLIAVTIAMKEIVYRIQPVGVSSGSGTSMGAPKLAVAFSGSHLPALSGMCSNRLVAEQ